MSEFWDNRYSESGFAYSKSPNLYFKKFIYELKPGKLLLPAEGEGRNAVYAAANGWKVTAIDSSQVAREKALKFASENNVKFEYFISDVKDFEYPEEEFDAAALIFAHFPPDIRTIVHQSVVKSLKPGGKLILEAFNKKQINNNSGGPKEIFRLYNIEYLKNDFRDLNILELAELETELDEGKYHLGKSDVIRLFAEKLI
jgi:SAM-dependent methyltransferase